MRHSIPPNMMTRILLIEPLLQGGEIIEHGSRVHLPLPRQGFERVRPRAALAHGQHLRQLCSRRFITVNRAAVQRARVPRFLAQRAVKLKLQYRSQKITRVWNIVSHMIFCARIEISLAASDGRRDALIFPPQFPPRFVVIGGLDFAGEHFPAPLVHKQAERQKCHFVQGALQQQADVRRRRRYRLDQANLFQIFRSNRQRDGVANRFVETVIRAALK
jgi:hypothetical protein